MTRQRTITLVGVVVVAVVLVASSGIVFGQSDQQANAANQAAQQQKADANVATPTPSPVPGDDAVFAACTKTFEEESVTSIVRVEAASTLEDQGWTCGTVSEVVILETPTSTETEIEETETEETETETTETEEPVTE